jgi:hypothetical protein
VLGATLLNVEALSADETIPAPLLQTPSSENLTAGRSALQRSEEVRIAGANARSGRLGTVIRKSGVKVSPEKVMQSFNTWAYKREQPADPELMLQVIADAIRLNSPVPFVLYWGKGPRCRLDEPDIHCLDYLATLARRVRDIYEPGATIKLIFTDTHAGLNGHSKQSSDDYFGAIDSAARERGFESCWLSQLVQAATADGASEPADAAIPEDTLLRLEACAAKWYRGEGTAEDGAARYYRMSLLEKQAVQAAFPSSIFVTFNGSEFRGLFPDQMPIFYMYSLRRGMSVKPWFLPAPEMPLQAPHGLT